MDQHWARLSGERMLRLTWLGFLLIVVQVSVIGYGDELSPAVYDSISQFGTPGSGIEMIEWLGRETLVARDSTGTLSFWDDVSKRPSKRRSVNKVGPGSIGLLIQLRDEQLISSDELAVLVNHDLQPLQNELSRHFGNRICRGVSPNRRFCVLSGVRETDGPLVVLDCQTLKERDVRLSFGDRDSMAIDDHGERLVALKWNGGQCSLVAMDLSTNRQLWEEPNFGDSAIDGWWAGNLVFLRGSDRFSVSRMPGSVLGGEISIIDVAPKLIAELPAASGVVATAGRKFPVLAYADGASRVLALVDGNGGLLGRFRATDRVLCAAFSSDDSRLAVGTASGGIVVYDTARNTRPDPAAENADATSRVVPQTRSKSADD